MKFLAITLIVHAPDPVTGARVSTQERFREVVRNALLAEEPGLDGFGVGERHERPFISSSPPVVLSHLAAPTRRIRLFTAVTTLSLLDPVRAYEDYATLDHLSGGRPELIIGKGNGSAQRELFHVSPRTSGPATPRGTSCSVGCGGRTRSPPPPRSGRPLRRPRCGRAHAAPRAPGPAVAVGPGHRPARRGGRPGRRRPRDGRPVTPKTLEVAESTHRTRRRQGAVMTVQDIDRTSFVQQWEEWHAAQQRALADPHGFLAITSLRWLDAEPTRFPDAPGAWSSTGQGVSVLLDEGEELVVDGGVVRGRYDFGVIPERTSVLATAGDAVIEVAKRGGYDIVRPRHPGNRLRTEFTRTPAYAPDPRWVVTGRYVPFDAPRPVTVGASVEGLQHVYDAPGELEFELDGATYRLTAFNGSRPGSLQVLFLDATSGVTTYAANRSLSVEPPAEDGGVVLDFNRATNLPCAYTDLATCPLPPAGNRLPVAIEAGQKIPYERGGH